MYKKLIVLSLIFALILAGCAPAAAPAADSGDADAEAAAEGEPVELRFISWQVDEAGVGDWWEAAIAEFESTHPGVTIDFTKVDRDAYVDTMTTFFVGGEAPDIVHLASFEYPQFADEGWLENLGPWIEESDLDLTDWAGQGKCEWNGEIGCIMLLYFGFVMVYNQALFEEAGLEYPTNWDEYLAAARELTKDTDGDGIFDQYGTSHQTTAGNQYLTEMLSYVLDAGAYWTDDEGNVTMDTPEMIEALGRWKTILTENLTPLDLSSGDARQLMAEGRIAMHPDGPWIWGIVQGAEPEIFEDLVITVPPFDPPVGGSSNVITMPADISQERKELVWDFIELITTQEWQEQYGLVSGQPAPRPNTITEEYAEKVPHIDVLVESQAAAAAAGVDRLPKGHEPVFNEFAKIVFEEMQNMVINDLDPAEVAATLQEKTEALQAR